MPPGYEECDESGVPYLLRVEKPIYGIPQAGRRLQRKAFPWFLSLGLRQCTSDECVFLWRPESPEDKEVFVVGIYVDNLQIVHSSPMGDDGNATDPDSFLAFFLDKLRTDWDIVDEGTMEDLLAIQARYNSDGSITLHQTKYIEKLLSKYLPNGCDNRTQRNSLPHSEDLVEKVLRAVERPLDPPPSPSLLRAYQQRIGALMYLTTSTRVDIAFVTHMLARAASRPTEELLKETDKVFCYLSHHRSVGLTYHPAAGVDLHGYSDASWEVRHSTSGWVVVWQGAALSWGSSKQPCVALSSCEAEIVALSESCKDLVYLRKVISDLLGESLPPSSHFTDNKSARDLAYNPEHHKRTKHVERRHFFVRDMVEKLELVVPFVNSADNLADFLTKPLPAKRFFALRRRIMNEPTQ